MKDMEMKVRLICSVCGNDQFSAIDENLIDIDEADDDIKVKCSDCGREITKEQLLEENTDVINANIEDFKDEIMKEVVKDFKKLFK